MVTVRVNFLFGVSSPGAAGQNASVLLGASRITRSSVFSRSLETSSSTRRHGRGDTAATLEFRLAALRQLRSLSRDSEHNRVLIAEFRSALVNLAFGGNAEEGDSPTTTSDLTMEEMTEASDRIYNEVGEDADIIWGTVVDDNIGDEIRVTVIATGIGKDSEAEEKLARPLRGRIRDIVPDDLEQTVDYDEPTFIRQKKAVGESSGAIYRGTDGGIITESELDIPTFLRRKAD